MKNKKNRHTPSADGRGRTSYYMDKAFRLIALALFVLAPMLCCCGETNQHQSTLHRNGRSYIGSPLPLKSADYRKVVPTLYPQRDERILQLLTGFKDYFDSQHAKTANSAFNQASQLISVHISGGFASGFVTVVRDNNGLKSYVVTNRHVIADARSVNLVFEDGREYHEWEVLYEDDKYDLAVLRSPRSMNSFEWGLVPDMAAVVERQSVVAVGFPAIGNHASYQTTSGQISNCAFELKNDQNKLSYLQHTAPIDPGSSGGPLLNEKNGNVSGVNTAIVRNRSNVGLAIPSEALLEVLEEANEFEHNMTDPQWREASLRQAATRFAGEISSSYSTPQELSRWISNDFVSQNGGKIMLYFHKMGIDSSESFLEDPLMTLRIVSVIYLKAFFESTSPNIQFREINPNDLPLAEPIRTPRTFFTGSSGTVEIVWILEHGHWRIAEFG